MLQEASHRGHLAHNFLLSASAPSVRWSYKAGGEIESSPVVSDDLVFSAAGKTVFALDRRTGEKKWTFRAKSQVLASGALGGGAFFAGSDDKHFYALDQQTGKLLWKFKADEFTGGVAVGEEEGAVYVGSATGQLHAYFFNGTKRFNFDAGGNVASTPALDETGIYFGDDAGTFFKLDRHSGSQVWNLKFASGIRCPARLEEDGIFITIGDPDGSKSGEVVRVDYDGKVRWRADCGGGKRKCLSCWTSPAVVGNIVIAGCGLDSDETGVVWGLDKATGDVRWKFSAGNDCQTSSPVVIGDAVVLGCIDGKLYALNAADGHLRWSFTAGAGIWATAALDEEGTIYVGSHDGKLYALQGASPGGLNGHAEL